jgi:hypothetical protein
LSPQPSPHFSRQSLSWELWAKAEPEKVMRQNIDIAASNLDTFASIGSLDEAAQTKPKFAISTKVGACRLATVMAGRVHMTAVHAALQSARVVGVTLGESRARNGYETEHSHCSKQFRQFPLPRVCWTKGRSDPIARAGYMRPPGLPALFPWATL